MQMDERDQKGLGKGATNPQKGKPLGGVGWVVLGLIVNCFQCFKTDT